MKIVEELGKRKILDKKKVASLLQEAKGSDRPIEEIILEKGLVEEKLLFNIKSEFLGVQLKKVSVGEIPAEILDSIPKDSAEYYKMIPIKRKDNSLEIGMIYPENLKAQEALQFLARQQSFKYQVFLITPSDFKDLFRKYQTLGKEVKTALADLEEQLQIKRPGELKPATSDDINKRVAEAPISKMVAVILRHAVDGKASDIHIEPLKGETRVRFRLDGLLHSSLYLPTAIHSSIVSRIKIISNLKIDETRIPQDGRFSITVDNENIDFRVSTFPTMFGEKVVMRVLNPTQRLKTFEGLGLEGKALKAVKEAAKLPYGTILATGPTGCGKTTTLYAILDSINKDGANVVTLEDPVEYYIKGINQSQVKPEIGYDFANGLRHIVRQDPDIIMVGEIRDPETAELATHASLTGHLVLSTLHTNNAIGVIPRLIDLGVKPFLIPATLTITLAQRLVRRLCDNCKKEARVGSKMKEMIFKEVSGLPNSEKKKFKSKDISVWKADGCPECGGTGYSGRIGIFEVLRMDKEISNIILEQPSEVKIAQAAEKQGMITMRQDGIIKVLKGLTTVEEVVRATEAEY